PVPEMRMIVMLAGIVEQAGVFAKRTFYCLFERFSFPFAAFQQLIARVHVGEVVLVVMVFQRFARHIGRKRVIGVRQLGERKWHDQVPFMDGLYRKLWRRQPGSPALVLRRCFGTSAWIEPLQVSCVKLRSTVRPSRSPAECPNRTPVLLSGDDSFEEWGTS